MCAGIIPCSGVIGPIDGAIGPIGAHAGAIAIAPYAEPVGERGVVQTAAAAPPAASAAPAALTGEMGAEPLLVEPLDAEGGRDGGGAAVAAAAAAGGALAHAAKGTALPPSPVGEAELGGTDVGGGGSAPAATGGAPGGRGGWPVHCPED